MQQYRVIATLGPATESELLRSRLLHAGCNAFRLNTSHMSAADVASTLERIAQLEWPERGRAGASPTVVLDLQGSKWRLGDYPGGTLAAGDSVVLMRGTESDAAAILPVPHGDFFRAVRDCCGEIRLNDGRVILRVQSIHQDEVRCSVETGGPLSARKGVTVAGTRTRTETLGDRDAEILRQTRGAAGVAYAFSYVRDAAEMRTFRSMVDHGAAVIAKIERESAIADVEAISNVADEVWLCRGDLGAELGLLEMARSIRHFSGSVPELGSPCLLAGQVLQHMTVSPTATRSEITTIYDAVAAGYAGFVLSDETALGAYPVESCRTAAMFRQ
ncbi:MAG: hypothetical protein EA404_01440 [Spirochaetaceae bacterium]|nr:MAG: hypothetical protein EA404_01440 [Spirochaetaceae bacterium]